MNPLIRRSLCAALDCGHRATVGRSSNLERVPQFCHTHWWMLLNEHRVNMYHGRSGSIEQATTWLVDEERRRKVERGEDE